MRLAKRLAFLGFDNPSGSERGEQPLSRGSSASKSLVVSGSLLTPKENIFFVIPPTDNHIPTR